MFNTFLFLLPVVLAVESRIQVPFLGSRVPGDIEIRIKFNGSIGVPEQEFQFHLGNGPYFYTNTLYVKNKATYGDGFDPDQSSTFQPIRNITYNEGTSLNATETVTLGGQVLKRKPIQVIYKTESNYLGRGRIGVDKYLGGDENCPKDPSKCTSFVQSVVRDHKEQVLVLAFDKVQRDVDDNPFTGQLFLGERPKDYCKSNWAFLEELPINSGVKPYVGYQWSFNISSVSVGKFSWKNPVGWGLFNLIYGGLSIPRYVYNGLLKTIGPELPCNTTENFVFNLGGLDVKLTPEMYLMKSFNNVTCEFAGSVDDYPIYRLPIAILSEHCLAFNYERFGLEISERVKN